MKQMLARHPMAARRQDSRKTGKRHYWSETSWTEQHENRLAEVAGVVELGIDIDGLLQMLGPRALKSQTGVPVEASGLIEVRTKNPQEMILEDWHLPKA